MNPKRILIVEDVQSIRKAMLELLREKYTVFGAENYDSAVKVLETESIDLVITDIKMPGKSGLDLIKLIQEKYPKILYALITAYDINSYINFAKEHKVWNIIPKYSSLDIQYIAVLIDKLFTKDIFGVQKYYPDIQIIEDRKETKFEKPELGTLIFKTIKTDKQREVFSERIANFFTKEGAPRAVRQILEELTSNAMIRAPKDPTGKSKFQIEDLKEDRLTSHQSVKLAKSDYFDIGYGIFKKAFILVTRDQHGTLQKEEILHRLDRQVTTDPETGKPLGVHDSHGRGLYICREMSDQLIFNIQKNKKTEVIAIMEMTEAKAYKGISIFEIEN
jgi:CheY-like chemotaxis protein